MKVARGKSVPPSHRSRSTATYERNSNMHDTNKPGPKTEEGKQHSSQNATTHGITAKKSILIAGETQEEFDRHLYRFTKEHQPKSDMEEGLVFELAVTDWRRLRIPGFEADAINKALQANDTDMKALNNFAIYHSRLTRSFQTTLKQLKETQAERRKRNGILHNAAACLTSVAQYKGLTYDPAADGFVFSIDFIKRNLSLFERLNEAARLKLGNHLNAQELTYLFNDVLM